MIIVDKDRQKKINNNNRKRGGAFEKRVADILDMFVVPYSGSNSRFGWGDVRGNEGTGKTTFLIECKNFNLDKDRYKIKKEWLDKNRERALVHDALPILAFMKAGSPLKHVFLEPAEFAKLNLSHNRCANIGRVVSNVFIDEEDVKKTKQNDITRLVSDNVVTHGYIMTLETFKVISDEYRIEHGEIQRSE